MGKTLDLVGQAYGRLTVHSLLGTDGHGYRLWHCVCECGGTISVNTNKLRVGDTKSCGCLSRETRSKSAAARNFRHGHMEGNVSSPTYGTWYAMMQRCRYPKHKSFKSYGGRGITVCERWERFENFLADMGERPAGTTLDRKEVNGNYEPNNCRWASNKTQHNNKRTSRYVEWEGRVQTLAEWAAEFGMPRQNLRRNLLAGWSMERIAALRPQRHAACQ